jgi:seryl-tRNA synthetase
MNDRKYDPTELIGLTRNYICQMEEFLDRASDMRDSCSDAGTLLQLTQVAQISGGQILIVTEQLMKLEAGLDSTFTEKLQNDKKYSASIKDPKGGDGGLGVGKK